MATSIQGASRRLLKQLRQREAVTGISLTGEQVEGIIKGEFGAIADRGIAYRTLEETQKRTKLFEEQIKAEEEAAAISGAADIIGLGANVYLGAKRIGVEKEKAAALSKLIPTPAVTTGTPAVTGATAGATVGATGVPASTTFSPFVAGSIGAFAGSLTGEGGPLQIGKGKGAELAGKATAATVGFMLGGPIGALAGVSLDFIDDATVICAELYRQGYLPMKILRLDSIYRHKHITETEYEGYLRLALPVVELMKRSPLFTGLVKPFGLAWAYTMANRVDENVKVGRVQKFIGTFILKAGLPICRVRRTLWLISCQQ